MGGNPVPLDCVRELTMWARIRERLADWYILIFAICLVAGGMFAASHQAAPRASQQSTTQTPTGPSPANVAGSQQLQRVPSATPPGPSQPSPQQTPTSPAASHAASVAAAKQTSLPAPHDHGMQTIAANAPSPPTMREQAPVATAAAAISGDGDAAAGRLVYRK